MLRVTRFVKPNQGYVLIKARLAYSIHSHLFKQNFSCLWVHFVVINVVRDCIMVVRINWFEQVVSTVVIGVLEQLSFRQLMAIRPFKFMILFD